MSQDAGLEQPDRMMSGLGGTGTGTGLAGVGLSIGADEALGQALLLVSPAAAIVCSGLLFYMHLAVHRWLEDREANRARATLKRALEDDDVPEADKEEFRSLLARHHRDRIARGFDRVNIVSRLADRQSDNS